MKYIKLGNISTIRTGKLDANAKVDNGKYPFFTCSKEISKIDSYSFDCECVLVAGNGDLNAKYYNGKFDAYQRTYVIELNDKIKYDTKYIYLIIESNIEELRNQSIGGVIKYIKLCNLTNINIPDINIDEQRKIVDKILKLDTILQKKQSQLESFNNLIKSQFVEMFGTAINNDKNYEIKQLNDYLVLITYGLTVRPKFVDDGTNLISARELKSGIVDFDSSPKISIDDYEKLSDKAKPKKGEILFSKTGTIGHCAIIETDNQFAVTQNAARISVKEDIINSKWLLYYLKTDDIQLYCNRQAKGNAVKDFQIQDMKKIPVLSVPLDLQSKYVKIVEQIDKQKFEYEQSIKNLEELRDSLMQKYFE